MSWDDEPTPVVEQSAQLEIIALKTQLDDLRLEIELQRPIVETAKILSDRWSASAGEFDEPVAAAVEMLFRMVEAARSYREGSDHDV